MTKRALIFGLSNTSSIAFGVYEAMKAQGIDIIVATAPALVERAQKAVPDTQVFGCNVQGSAADILRLKEEVSVMWEDGFDYLVHAVAFSDTKELKGSIFNTSRENYLATQDISAYSLVELCRHFVPMMRQGGSVATFTFAASRYRSPNYNTMAPAKSALETLVKYIAFDPMLADKRMTINAISAGPIKTLSLMGVGGAGTSLKMGARRSAIGENVTAAEVGMATLNIMNSPGITGQTINVDWGISCCGMGAGDTELAFNTQHG